MSNSTSVKEEAFNSTHVHHHRVDMEESVGAGFWRPFDTARPPPVKSEPSAVAVSIAELGWDPPPPFLANAFSVAENLSGRPMSTPSDQLSAPCISPAASPLSSDAASRSQSESPDVGVLVLRKEAKGAKKKRSSKRSSQTSDQQTQQKRQTSGAQTASSGQASRRRGRSTGDMEKKVGVVQGLPRKETALTDDCGAVSTLSPTTVAPPMTSAHLNLSDSVANSNAANSSSGASGHHSAVNNSTGVSAGPSSGVSVVMDSPRNASYSGSSAGSYSAFPSSAYVQSWPHLAFSGHSYMVPLSPMFGFGELGEADVLRQTLPPAAHQHPTTHHLLAPAFHSSPLPPTPSPTTPGIGKSHVSRACSPLPGPSPISVATQTEVCSCWRCLQADPGPALAPLLISPDSTALTPLPDAVSPKSASPDALNTLYQVAQTILGQREEVEHGNCVSDLHVRYDTARTTELPAPGAVSHFPQLEGIQEWERGTLRQMSAIQSRVREVKSLIRRKKRRHPSSASSGGQSTKQTTPGPLPPPQLQPEAARQQENLRLLAACAVEMRPSPEGEPEGKEEPPTLTAVSEAEKTRDSPPIMELPVMVKPSTRGDRCMPDLSLSVEANNPPLLLPSPPAVARKRGHTHDGVPTERRKRMRKEMKEEEEKKEKEELPSQPEPAAQEEEENAKETKEEEEEKKEALSPIMLNEDDESRALLHLDADSANHGDRIIFLMGKLKTGRLTIQGERQSFGLVFDCDRGGGPHQILSAAELGNMVIREVRPESDDLAKDSRVCAYWSKYQSHLYPGHIATPDEDEPAKPGPGFVYISFDDQFCGWIELGHVRLLPSDFPILPTSEDDLALALPLGRRRARSGEVGPALANAAKEEGEEEAVKEEKEEEDEEDLERPLVISEPTPVAEEKESKPGDSQAEVVTLGELKEEEEGEEEEEAKKKKKKKKKKKRRVTWRWADPGQRKGGRIFYKAVERSQDGEHVKVGDAVLFSSGEERPYLGQVHAMFENADAPGNPMFVCATWYYQPREMGSAVEDSLKNLKSAVFASRHADENDARTILRKIRVLPNYATYKKYRRKARNAAKAGKTGSSMKDVYFTAGRFDPLAKRVLQYDQTLKRLYMERRRETGQASSCFSSAASSCSSVASSISSHSAEAQWAVARAVCEAELGKGDATVEANNNVECSLVSGQVVKEGAEESCKA